MKHGAALLLCLSLVGCHSESAELDHLVYAGPDLGHLAQEFSARSGATVEPGGQLPGLGLHNRSVPLDQNAFVELVSRDPSLPLPGVNILGIDRIRQPTLVTWAAHVKDFDGLYARLKQAGVAVSPVVSGSRGNAIAWRYFSLTDPRYQGMPRLVPHIITYDRRPPRGEPHCTLVSVRAVHPNPEIFTSVFGLLGIKLEIEKGTPAKLRAVLQCPKGRVTLE